MMTNHVTNTHPPIIAAPTSPSAGESSDNDVKIPASSSRTSPASDPMEGGITSGSFDEVENGGGGEFQLDGCQYLPTNLESTDGTNVKDGNICGNGKTVESPLDFISDDILASRPGVTKLFEDKVLVDGEVMDEYDHAVEDLVCASEAAAEELSEEELSIDGSLEDLEQV